MTHWNLEDFSGKHVVFVGVGKGRAMTGVQDFLGKHGNIASFTGVDKQSGEEPLSFLRAFDPNDTVFIKNEAIPGQEMPVPYVTSMQLFFRLVTQVGSLTVGITGTKGKSTTTALTAHILKSAGKDVVLAGNIGVSPLLALDEATKDTLFVLELSSYQLSDLQTSPHISACVNLFNDHTDWHGTLESYWEAKHNIMRYAGSNDLFVYNASFPALQEWAAAAGCRTKAINPDEDLDLSKSQLFGEHNRLNALVAREIARELGVEDEITQKAIESFETLEHRMELVATKQGRTYIDDAIGMTPESTMASLQAIGQKFGTIGCLMLGGQDRGYDFTKLLEVVAAFGIPSLVLFPDTAQKIKDSLPDGYSPEIIETRDMSEAVKWSAAHAPANSVVLLSTAAPSYSVWRDFEEKGKLFKEAVSLLGD